MDNFEKIINELHDTWDSKYVSQETYDFIIESLSKQIPTRVVELNYGIFKCPNCNHSISIEDYCEHCGQHLTFTGA